MQKLVKQIQARAKAVVAAAGVVVGWLYQFNATHPSHVVTYVIGVLTVLGVHQLSNK